MLNNKVLECLEQNIEGLERLSYFMKYGEEFACRDLILEINMDQFEGYECLLPVILLTSDDPVIGRTEKRLLLQLYSERIQELGARRMVGRVADILNEEYKLFIVDCWRRTPCRWTINPYRDRNFCQPSFS